MTRSYSRNNKLGKFVILVLTLVVRLEQEFAVRWR